MVSFKQNCSLSFFSVTENSKKYFCKPHQPMSLLSKDHPCKHGKDEFLKQSDVKKISVTKSLCFFINYTVCHFARPLVMEMGGQAVGNHSAPYFTYASLPLRFH